jgi:hypothetical protein
MRSIIESIKYYFAQREKGLPTEKTPYGMCPTCWGFSEWDGHHYKMMQDKRVVPGSEIYESFISKIVDKHIKTTHKRENKYICTTCDKEILFI